MKIKEIKRKEGSHLFLVTLKPNWLELLFGVKEKTWEFEDSGRTYVFGDGTVYIRKDGEKTRNGSRIGEAIDKYRRSF